ncbi:MAG: hypothetical protein AAF198_10685 [Pseudomonadota bacterium]
MEQDYSLEALLDFIDYLSDKGLMKVKTASAVKASANKFFSALDPEELIDLRKIDIDQAATRFNNKFSSNYDPTSLRSYRNRSEKALNDFLSWKADPANFKPGIQTRTRRPKESQTQMLAPSLEARVLPKQTDIHSLPDVQAVPIRIREGHTVTIEGLPFDLTDAEARKISNIVQAYVQISE